MVIVERAKLKPNLESAEPQAKTIWAQSSKGFILPFTGFFIGYYGLISYFERTRYTHIYAAAGVLRGTALLHKFSERNTLSSGPTQQVSFELTNSYRQQFRMFYWLPIFGLENMPTCWSANMRQITRRNWSRKGQSSSNKQLTLFS